MTIQAPHLPHPARNPHNPLPETDPAACSPLGRKIRIAMFGLGIIGLESAKLAAEKSWIELVGGIDVDPAKAGKTLGDFTKINSLSQVPIFKTFEQLLDSEKPDVVIHAAGSKVADTFDQLEPMIRAGVSVTSSCEELLYPMLRAPERSAAFDELCRQYGAGVVGTGVNPGFVMDVLPVCLTGVSRSVKSIYAERVVNASTRRMQLQRKIGSGMEPEAFRNLFRQGKAGHAGFRESASLVCHCMGWTPEAVVETCEPIIADHDITTEFFQVKKGLTCGLHQIVKAHVNGEIPLVMDLKMYLDAADPHDAIKIEGHPNLDMLLRGGVSGDHATIAALVNSVPRLLKAGPGLHLSTDLPVPSWIP